MPLPSSAWRALTSTFGDDPSPDTVAQSAGDLLVENPARFHFDSAKRMFGEATVALVTTGPCRYGPTRTRPAKWLHLVLVLNGTVLIRSDSAQGEQCRQGEAFATSDPQAVSVESAGPVRVLVLRLSHDRLRRFGLRIRGPYTRFGSASLALLPLRAFALALLDPSWKPGPSGAGPSVIERVLEELVLGLFLDAEDPSVDDADLRALLRNRAVAHVAAEHHSPDLTPAVVAAHLGVSLRHLQRAFEGEEATVAQLIMNNRTASAAVILRGLSTRHLTLDEVAARVGFSSTFELRAAFKSQYGTLPSTFRVRESLRAVARHGSGEVPGTLITRRIPAGRHETRTGPVIMATTEPEER